MKFINEEHLTEKGDLRFYGDRETRGPGERGRQLLSRNTQECGDSFQLASSEKGMEEFLNLNRSPEAESLTLSSH